MSSKNNFQKSMIILSKKLFLSIYLLICLNSHYLNASSLVTLPFTYINKKTNTSTPCTNSPKEYFESLLNYPVYTTLNINDKPVKFHITLDRYTTYISNKTLLEIDPKHAEIKADEDLYSLDYIGIHRAKFTNSIFEFISNDNNITLNNYSFFMTKEMCDEFDYTIRTKYLATEDEEIGLNVLKGNKVEGVPVEEDDDDDPYGPYDDEYQFFTSNEENAIVRKKLGEKWVNKNNGYLVEENTNLIYQLKKEKYISSYAYTILFDNKDEEKGKIIIGDMPHEYDPKHYLDRYFIYYTATLGSNNGNPFGNWGINFIDIKYDGVSLPYIKSAEFELNFGFILSTPTYKTYLDYQFFNDPDYSKYCKEEKVDIYLVKYCEENVIKEFKNISFHFPNKFNTYNESNALEFDYKDLFVKAPGDNNLYYFQIIFPDNTYFKWKLGRPVFKKYQMAFDQNKRIFGFYTQTGEYETNDNQNKEYGQSLSLSWILVIILSIILIALGIAFYKLLPYIKRRKRANELEDEYDYPNTEVPNNEQKNDKKALYKD